MYDVIMLPTSQLLAVQPCVIIIHIFFFFDVKICHNNISKKFVVSNGGKYVYNEDIAYKDDCIHEVLTQTQ